MHTFCVPLWLFTPAYRSRVEAGSEKDICFAGPLDCKMNNVLNGSTLAFSFIGLSVPGRCEMSPGEYLFPRQNARGILDSVSKFTSWSFPWYPAAHVSQEDQGGGLLHACIPERHNMDGRIVRPRKQCC